MTLKEMIHQYKIKTGYSDSELARRCNVSRSTVARWSSGENRVGGSFKEF